MKKFNFLKKSANTPPRRFRGASRIVWVLILMLTIGVGQMWGTDYEEMFTITSGAIAGSSYASSPWTYTDAGSRGWIITYGGNNKSVGTNTTNRGSCDLSDDDVQKYAVSPVTTSNTASAFASTTSISNVSKISYSIGGGKNYSNTKVYLIYSANGTTFSQMTLSSGTQGSAPSTSSTSYVFSTCSGYFGLLFKDDNTSGDWRLDDVSLTFYEESNIAVTSVSVDPTSKAIVVGETFTVTPTVLPNNATNKNINWSSSATEKATVTNAGLVTGVAAGSANIKATSAADATKNATCAVTVYSVTVQVVDEDGNTLSGSGMPTASATGRNITASEKGNNYVFKTWEFVGDNNGLSFGTATNASTTLSGTPTGNVTIKAVYHKPIAVIWKVNGKAWTPSAKSGVDGTAEVGYGEQVSTLPTDPTTAEFCGQKFMGWTTTPIGSTGLTDADEISALNLFTTAGNSPSITTETTFHAVFADYAE